VHPLVPGTVQVDQGEQPAGLLPAFGAADATGAQRQLDAARRREPRQALMAGLGPMPEASSAPANTASTTSGPEPPSPPSHAVRTTREGRPPPLAQPAASCFFAAFCSCLKRRTSASDSGPVMSATERCDPSSP
jgi:hypothetical protein